MEETKKLKAKLSRSLRNWNTLSDKEIQIYLLEILEHLEILENNPSNTKLRQAWEAGFTLCASYGDNKHHFCGEQKENNWKKFLETLNNE